MPPQSLVDAVKLRTAVPFVGSGLSVSVGRGLFPDWKGLIERLATRLDKEGLAADASDVRTHLAAQRFPEAAELAFEKLTPSRFSEEMQAVFDRRLPPPNANLSAVEALWRLRPRTVITTNYDSALEWPFAPRGGGRPYAQATDPPGVAYNDEPALLQRIITPRDGERPQIWHLHGSVNLPSTLILTKPQYERLYAAGSAQAKSYAFALEQLRSLIANRTFFFIGFSLDDPFLARQLEYILDVTAKQNPVSFLLMKKGEKDPGAMLQRYQVQIIEFEDFGAPMVRAINEVAEAAWGRVAPGASVPGALVGLVDDLGTILTHAAPDPAVVGRAFNRWKPQGWTPYPVGGDGVKLALAAAEKLAGAMRQKTEDYPLLEFVRDVAARVLPDDQKRLSTWLDAAADALGIDAADSARLKAGGFVVPEAAGGGDNYILVRIEDSANDQWRVQAWLFGGSEPWKLFPDEWDAARSDLASIVYELLDRVTALELDNDHTAVAFMVPRALLVEAIDQVVPTVEFAPRPPIGATLPVTVRPLDRLKWRTNLRQLGASWPVLKAAASAARPLEDAVPPAQPGAAVWLRPGDAGPDLIERLQKHRITCAVLSTPPPATAPDPARDLFNCVLQAAVPAVVWLREPAAADQVTSRARVEQILNEATLALPQRVWKQRRDARGLADPAHPGVCLVLLWDDADRLPPDRDPANRAGIPRA